MVVSPICMHMSVHVSRVEQHSSLGLAVCLWRSSDCLLMLCQVE